MVEVVAKNGREPDKRVFRDTLGRRGILGIEEEDSPSVQNSVVFHIKYCATFYEEWYEDLDTSYHLLYGRVVKIACPDLISGVLGLNRVAQFARRCPGSPPLVSFYGFLEQGRFLESSCESLACSTLQAAENYFLVGSPQELLLNHRLLSPQPP